MISFDEAVAIMREQVEPLPVRRVKLPRIAGYVLAESLIAPAPIPRFDSSAMDGFGVRVEDVAPATHELPVRLPIQATICAGDSVDLRLNFGQAVKILTGAPIPAGVETVVMREVCTEDNGTVLVKQSARAGENIRRAGEEFAPGDLVLPAGTRVTPPVVGLLATLGYKKFLVRRKPKVALLVTGSELVAPGEPLRPGQIYDSNSFALLAALHNLGIERCPVFHAADEPDATRDRLRDALKAADMVLTIGGVSVGDYDFVKDACAQLKISEHFWKVAIKPAKPVFFGTQGRGRWNKYLFGLPGNPVSALLAFHYFARPALLGMMGLPQAMPFQLTAELAADLKKKPGRLEFVRGVATMENGKLIARPVTGQDSHMLGGLSQANCIIRFPAEAERLAAGQTVYIDLMNWG